MALPEFAMESSHELASMRGHHVVSWVGVELALWASAEGGAPRFNDPRLPCLHLYGLQATLDNGDAMSISTYQDDAYYGLRAHPAVHFVDKHWDGIYRRRQLTELPTGQVERVATFADKDVLAEAHLRIGAKPLLLIAGELDGTPEDGLLCLRLDDSVLAFTDPAAAQDAPWVESREGLTAVHD